MNVTVEIINHCEGNKVPNAAQCKNWITNSISHLGDKNTDKDSNTSLSISIRFVTSADSQALNFQYRQNNSPTNVLSFPVKFSPKLEKLHGFRLLGDLALCPAIIEQEANDQGKKLEAHWAHLIIHGLYHLLGFDHKKEKEAQFMEELEIKALEKLGFSNPYLLG